MADKKNFNLTGIGSNVQYGKGGGRIRWTTDHLEARNPADTAFADVYVPLTPGNDQAAASKSYVDEFTTTLVDAKNSVRVATTADGAFTTAYDNGSSIDAVVLATGDRILIKDQSDGTENGIYIVQLSGAPIRANDANTDAEMTQGAFTIVILGTVNAKKIFVLTTPDPITVGTTAQTWEEASSGGGGGGNSFGIVTGDTGTATADTATDTLQIQGATSGGITTTASDAPELIIFGLTPIDLATTGATIVGGDFIIVSDSADTSTTIGQKVTWTNVISDLGLLTSETNAFGVVTGDTGTATSDTTNDTLQLQGAISGGITTIGSDAPELVTFGLTPIDFATTGATIAAADFLIVSDSADSATTLAQKVTFTSALNDLGVPFAGGNLDINILDIKLSVRVATTANITLSGEQTIDDILTSTNRILVKDQSTGSENGIYVTAAGAWSRASDSDADAEVTQGNIVFVSEGTISAKFSFILTTADPITVSTTGQTWESSSGGGGGATTFTGLTDTPSAFTGESGTRVTVNNAESALVFEGTQIKDPAAVATTANVTLSGEQSIDGITTVTDRILVKNQTAGAENGIYVTATGAWTRTDDFDDDKDAVLGCVVAVNEGTAGAQTLWQLANITAVTIGTTAQTWTQIGAGGGATTYLGLTDTPSSFSGEALNVPRVNSAETAIEFVPPTLGSFGNPFSGALRRRATTSGTFPQGQTNDVLWDATDYDIGGWVFDTIEWIVPTGVTKVLMKFGYATDSGSNTGEIQLSINETNPTTRRIAATFVENIESATGNNGQVITSIIDVVAGHRYKVRFGHNTGSSRTLQGSTTDLLTWFSIEAVESVAPASKVIGPWLELDRQIASATSVIDFTFNPALFDELEITIRNLAPTVDGDVMWLRVSLDGGSTFKAAASDYDTNIISGAAELDSVTDIGTQGIAQIILSGTMDNAANRTSNMTIWTAGLDEGGDKEFHTRIVHTNTGGNWRDQLGSGKYKGATTAVNGLRFLLSTSTIATGTFILRGRPKAGVDFYSSSRSLTGMPFSGALTKLTSDFTINDASTTIVDWDDTEYDVGGWWSSGNADRLIVPAGITKVLVSAGLALTVWTSGVRFLAFIRKNGVQTQGLPRQEILPLTTTNPTMALTGAVVDVVAGDYFTVSVFQDSGGVEALDGTGSTKENNWLAIEAVEAIAPSVTSRGALVIKTADTTGQDLTTVTAIAFDSEIYDTDAIHDNSTNNTRLTVPSGVTHVRLHGQIGIGELTSSRYVQAQLYKNGALFDPAIVERQEVTTTSIFVQMTSPIFEVVADDYFELMCRVESDISVTILDVGSYFSMEIIEPAIIAGLSPNDLSVKESVVVATTANGALATAYENGVTIDGVTLATGDRILLKNQTAAAENGIYIVQATGAPRRSADANSVLNIEQGIYVFVSEGTTNGATSWILDTDNPITPDTTSQNWVSTGTGKQTLWIPVNQMTPTVSNGCAILASVETVSGQPDQHILGFDTTVDEHAQFEIGLPKSWDKGTVTFKVFWTHQGTQTGGLDGVAWGLQGVALSSGDPFATAYGTPIVVTDDQVTGDDIYITVESAAITIAGTPVNNDLTFFRIFRDVSDAADDLDIDAQLVGIQLFITTNSLTDD